MVDPNLNLPHERQLPSQPLESLIRTFNMRGIESQLQNTTGELKSQPTTQELNPNLPQKN